MDKATVQANLDAADEIVEAARKEDRELSAGEQSHVDAALKAADDFEARQRSIKSLERATGTTHNPTSSTGVLMPTKQDAAIQSGNFEQNAFTDTLTKALTEGSGSGSYLVPQETWPNGMWDLLASQSVGLSSGFTVLTTTSDSMRIPQATADPSSAFTSEAGTISPTDPTWTETVATPHKIAAITRISNELRDDGNPDTIGQLSRQLLRSCALTADLGFYEGGTAAPYIKGMKNVQNINTIAAGANGAIVSPSIFVDAFEEIRVDNGEPTAIVMPPRTYADLMGWKDADGRHLLQYDLTAPASQPRIWGVPIYISSQLTLTETQGSSGAVCNSIYVYQASQIVVVKRADVVIEVDGSRYFDSDETLIRAKLRLDMQVPNPAAICRITGLTS